MAAAFTTTLALLDAVRGASRSPRSSSPCRRPPCTDRPASRDLPLKEQPLEPRGLRGVIARATVDLLATYREIDAVEFTVLALSTVYGPRQRPDGGVVAALVGAAADGRPPAITGDGRQTRDCSSSTTPSTRWSEPGTRGGGLVVNVGTGEQTSVRELWALRAGWRAAEPIRLRRGPTSCTRFAVSPVRARIHLGWSPWTVGRRRPAPAAVTATLSRTAARQAPASAAGDVGCRTSRSG